MLIMAATLTQIIPSIPEANDILQKPKLSKKYGLNSKKNLNMFKQSFETFLRNQKIYKL